MGQKHADILRADILRAGGLRAGGLRTDVPRAGVSRAAVLRKVPSAMLGTSPSTIENDEWVAFPGGELEGQPPRALCAACRDKLARAATSRSKAPQSSGRTICFQCYRADLERQQAMRAAGELDTASDARFQFQLPFEPVNRPRLQMLKTDRADARTVTPIHVDKRRRAQIEARHALQ